MISEKCQNFRMKPNCMIPDKMDRNGLGNRCSIQLSFARKKGRAHPARRINCVVFMTALISLAPAALYSPAFTRNVSADTIRTRGFLGLCAGG